jgi:UPF0271 protein
MRINCDLGEINTLVFDKQILPYVDIVNIALGAHAGSPERAQKLFESCLEHQKTPTAHIGYKDKVNFGRVEHNWSPVMIANQVKEQLLIIPELKVVKFHGALYNRLNIDSLLAKVIYTILKSYGVEVVLAPLDSVQNTMAKTKGIQVWTEVFGERTYWWDNDKPILSPRSWEKAVISDLKLAYLQSKQLLNEQAIAMWNPKTEVWNYSILKGDTICIHGDSPIALELLKKLQIE